MKTYLKVCNWCNKQFKTENGGRSYCNLECRKAMDEYWKKRNSSDLKIISEKRYNTYKFSAKLRKKDFLLSKEEIDYIVSLSCVYCGLKNIDTKMGVDRINNDLGYTKENSAPCCTVCNKMKLNYTKEFFLNHCKKINNFNN